MPVPEGKPVLVGRSIASDIHVADETVSRQHAELEAGALGISIRDLGSANGTLHNDGSLRGAPLVEGDVVSFGRVRFRVARGGDSAADPEPLAPGTLVRPVAIDSEEQALDLLQRDRLARLVALARELSGSFDTESLLEGVVTGAAALLAADRTALLLRDESTGEYRVTHWLNRLGKAAVRVPRSIVQRAIADGAPVVTENAREDARFQSGSVVSDQVRAALAVPLKSDATTVLGVLYVDSLTATQAFSDADAALCFAFAGLAAVAIAKSRMTEVARRQDVIRANLERFVAPSVAARIAARDSGARPGGERRGVTVLFSDIRGFTSLAEAMPPERVAEHLSDYFAVMVDLVFEHGGMLDKFAGDALLAVWGAPEAGAGDADHALGAALAMQEELARLNPRWAVAGRPPLHVGIGLHSGEAFAGLIGSPKRLEFTVIGDVVNVAARLCKAAAAGEILISDDTRGLLAAPPSAVRRKLELGERAVEAWSLGPRA